MNEAQIWTTIATERQRLVDDLRGTPAESYKVATQLPGWSAHHVLAHVATPFLTSTAKFALTMLRKRGSLDATNEHFADRFISNSPDQLLELIMANADSRWKPPGEPATLPLTEVVVHGQDIRRAIGVSNSVSTEVVATVIGAAKGAKKPDQAHIASLELRLEPT